MWNSIISTTLGLEAVRRGQEEQRAAQEIGKKLAIVEREYNKLRGRLISFIRILTSMLVWDIRFSVQTWSEPCQRGHGPFRVKQKLLTNLQSGIRAPLT